IGAGNMAARVNLRYEHIRERVPVIANDIAKAVSFGLGRSNPKPIDHAIFDSALWENAGVGHLKQMARAQLGTVGSGNHYVDLFEDEDGYVWIGAHFGSRERHGELDLWVVRKGATPAFPGQRGFVGGSMGDDAVILKGVESEPSAASLYSTVHGAGRVMSRTEAKGKRNPKTGEVIRE